MENEARIKSLRTRANTQRKKAEEIFEANKNIRTKTAKRNRMEANHLLSLAENNLKKAKALESGEDGSTLDFDTVYIDTVRAKLYDRSGHEYLRTPVAQAILAWLDDTVATFGNGAVAFACEKALEDNPYIWDEYIYDSDQAGVLTNDTLSILSHYAEMFIEGYEAPEIDTGMFDDTIGDEGIYE